jgi:sialic acid synthase
MRSLRIGTRLITDSSPCYVIAEIGGNHGGSVETAVKMVRVAAASGAEAVKFQCRDNATLYSDTLLNAAYENENSYGKTYGEHRAALELSDAALATCGFTAEQSGVACFSTAFDEPSVDRIVKLGMPAIKIASGGLTDLALLRYAGAARVPIILSTGGGTVREIDAAVEAIGHDQLAILHCCAAYPVRDWSQHNLRCISTFRERYPYVIGWSGHDNGIAMAMAAYSLGARIIEKHFTLDRSSKGTDHGFSLEPAGLGKMVRDLSRAHLALGDGVKRYYESEVAPLSKMRRRPMPDGTMRITGEKDVIPKESSVA